MMPKPSLPVVRTPRIDTVAIFTGTLGLLAHGAMVVLDAALHLFDPACFAALPINLRPTRQARFDVVPERIIRDQAFIFGIV